MRITISEVREIDPLSIPYRPALDAVRRDHSPLDVEVLAFGVDGDAAEDRDGGWLFGVWARRARTLWLEVDGAVHRIPGRHARLAAERWLNGG